MYAVRLSVSLLLDSSVTHPTPAGVSSIQCVQMVMPSYVIRKTAYVAPVTQFAQPQMDVFAMPIIIYAVLLGNVQTQTVPRQTPKYARARTRFVMTYPVSSVMLRIANVTL